MSVTWLECQFAPTLFITQIKGKPNPFSAREML